MGIGSRRAAIKGHDLARRSELSRPWVDSPEDDVVHGGNLLGPRHQARLLDTPLSGDFELLQILRRVDLEGRDLRTKACRLDLLPLGSNIWLVCHRNYAIFKPWMRQLSVVGLTC